MPHKTFFWFILPSLVAMLLFIALPIVSVAFQSLFIEHEQVCNVLEGTFELTIDGESRQLGVGQVGVIPSNAVHSGRAITACRVLDIFHPVREDYRIRT